MQTHKICSKCNIKKTLEEFYICRSNKLNGRTGKCKICMKEDAKEWYFQNPNKVLEYRNSQSRKDALRKYDSKPESKKRRLELAQADHRKMAKSEYKKRRRDHFNETSRVYQLKRRKIDLNFKLKDYLRKRLNSALKANQKSGSAVRNLGCSIEQFKQYLESKFQPGMTWENYGKYGWHIDHIKPLASFDLTNRDQLLQAVHYTNLQPLWACDNLSKGCRTVEV